MPRPDLALSILLINDRPDEIKLVTSSLRGFFGACRIEAAYTAEEGLTFSRRDDWQIIILDHNIVKGQDLDLLAASAVPLPLQPFSCKRTTTTHRRPLKPSGRARIFSFSSSRRPS